MLINKREETGLKHLSHPKVFIELTSNTGNICKNIEKYNPNEKRKSLIAFDDMIDNTISKKNLIHYWLQVIIMSHASFRVNLHSIICLNVKELLD